MGSVAQPANFAQDVFLMHSHLPADQPWVDKIESQYPGLKVRWAHTPMTLKAGPARMPSIPHDMYDGVTMLCTFNFTTHDDALLSKVRYIHINGAGHEGWVGHRLYEDPNVIWTTSNGMHGPQIAEWVIGTWLMHSHNLLAFAEKQKLASWTHSVTPMAQDSPGLRMGVLGYGAIGRQCARLGQALGMEVYAYTRSERSTPESRRDHRYCVPGTGDADGLIPSKWFHGASQEALDAFLAQDLDLLVLTLPLTKATRHCLGPRQFDLLSRKKTFVSNISRGRIIDQDALIEALRGGKIRAAALDVTDPEPLPNGHPLWSAPNVFVSPHISWQTPAWLARLEDIVEINLERLSKGGELMNMVSAVDREKGN